jgi:hypothetical protein
MKKKLIEFYLDYVNNYMTTQTFADAYDLDVKVARELLEIGKRLHESKND